jgi:hypothetical protein
VFLGKYQKNIHTLYSEASEEVSVDLSAWQGFSIHSVGNIGIEKPQKCGANSN